MGRSTDVAQDRTARLVDQAAQDVLGVGGQLTPAEQRVCDVMLAVDTHMVASLGHGGGKTTIRKVVVRALKLAEAEDRGVKL